MVESAIRRLNGPLLGLLLMTFLIRGGMLWVLRDNLEPDPDAYREIAENLLKHGGFALGREEPGNPATEYRLTAYRPPLYPLLLSNLASKDSRHLSVIKVAVLHLVLGTATTALTWLLACVYLGGNSSAKGSRTEFIPCLAGLIVAIDPILLNQQTLLMTETLATFLAVVSLWRLARWNARPTTWNAALAGSAIGLAILCRPTFLPWLAVVVLATALVQPREKLSLVRRIASALVIVLFTAFIVSPWVIRNHRLLGKPIATTTHGGYTLLLGNNDSFYDWLGSNRRKLPWDGGEKIAEDMRIRGRPKTVQDTNQLPAVAAAREELTLDALCYDEAHEAIERRPWSFLQACLYRVCQLWSPLPHQLTPNESVSRQRLRLATCVWYLAVYTLAIVGIAKLRWNVVQAPWLHGVLLGVAFTAVHTFYWTNLRMRAPLMPFVALLAAASLLHVSARSSERPHGQNGS